MCVNKTLVQRGLTGQGLLVVLVLVVVMLLLLLLLLPIGRRTARMLGL